MTKANDLALIRAHRKLRAWFYKPEWYWDGWRALVPMWTGHDEYSRNTLVIGWPFTGRIVVALGYCGDADCYEQTLQWIQEGNDDE